MRIPQTSQGKVIRTHLLGFCVIAPFSSPHRSSVQSAQCVFHVEASAVQADRAEHHRSLPLRVASHSKLHGQSSIRVQPVQCTRGPSRSQAVRSHGRGSQRAARFFPRRVNPAQLQARARIRTAPPARPPHKCNRLLAGFTRRRKIT